MVGKYYERNTTKKVDLVSLFMEFVPFAGFYTDEGMVGSDLWYHHRTHSIGW